MTLDEITLGQSPLRFLRARLANLASQISAMQKERSLPHTSFGTNEFGSQISDVKQAVEMVKLCMDQGCFDFDTAYIYGNGKSENMIGDIELLKDPTVYLSTKAGPWPENAFTLSVELGTDGTWIDRVQRALSSQGSQGLKYDRVIEQMNTSLERMKRTSVDLFYLHAPDHKTPIEETLKAVDQLYKEGKFDEFGLSNYSAWEVTEIYFICKNNNYVLPTVYQGMYNAVTRGVANELLPCLRRFGIRFYAYNPLAGGLLTGKYEYSDKDSKRLSSGRFFSVGIRSKGYLERFWHKSVFDTLDRLRDKLDEIYGKGSVTLTEAALRWMYHHSKLSGKYGDKVVLGASNMAHLEQNLKASKQDCLHEDIVKVFDDGWASMKGLCADYNR